MKKPLLFPSSNTFAFSPLLVLSGVAQTSKSEGSLLVKIPTKALNNSVNGIRFLKMRFFQLALFMLMLKGGFQQVYAQTPSYNAALPCQTSTYTADAKTKATTTYAALTAHAVAGIQLPTTVITESWIVTTDTYGNVGFFHGFSTNALTINITACLNQISNSRQFALYSYAGNVCTGSAIAPTTVNDGITSAQTGGSETNTLNPAWKGLTPNASYVVVVQTTVGVSCLDYVNSWGGYYGIPPQFTFNCGSATSTGTFIANGVSGQTGSLTIPLTGTTAGAATFNVTGAGFTGTLTQTLTAGQTSVIIPISFDGTGVVGNRSLTVTSSQGGGACTKVVLVDFDSDGDGVLDSVDLDDDNDGILDTAECPSSQIEYLHNDSNGQSDAATFVPTTASGYFSSTQNTSFGSGLNESTDNYAYTYLIRNATAANFTDAKIGNDYVQVSFLPSQNITIEHIGLGFFTNSNSVPDFNCGNFKIALEYSNNSAFTTPSLLFQDKQVGNMIAGGYLSYDYPIPSQLLSSGTNYFFRFYLYDEQNTDPSNRVRFDDLFIPFKVPSVCDLDGDGIANTIDLDSDGDGCPDAIEGGANFATTSLVTSTIAGGNSGTGYTGTSTSPVVKNLGNTVGSTTTTLGVPTVANTGQTVNNSQNKLVQSANCITCVAGTTAPIITATTVINTCPTTTVSLAGLANTGTKPAGTTLIWSTHKVPTSASDTLTNLTTVSTAGKYYALYFDKVNNCYSPADSVDATISVCLDPIAATNPPAQTAVINTPKTGTASTDLTPSGGNGTYVYSVDNTASCIIPSGGTAFPSGSNLTVTNSTTGVYTYTAPSTAGIYYYCIRVCDTNTPTSNCITKTYTLTVSSPTNIFNNCPENIVNLMAHIDSTNKPANSYVTWHTASTATATNQVPDPTSVAVSGTYYATYYETIVGCYGASTSPVTVTINPCPATIVTNICPAITVNLMSHIDSTNKKAGSYVTWHTSNSPTLANQIADPTTVTSGTYYAAYYSPSSSCYGLATSPIMVNIVACPVVCTPPSAPVLASNTKSNICPSTTADLTSLEPTALSGTTLEWHTVASNPTTADSVTTPSAVGAGTYYLYARATSPANCFSPASQGAVVTITVCCTAPATPVLSSTAAQSNTCPSTTVDLTSVQPTPASGTTLEWHSVATNPTATDLVTMPVSVSGMYYLYAKASSPANCFSPASTGVSVTIAACTACPGTLAVVKPTSPNTCGGNDGSITFSGLTASTTYIFNYEKDGGSVLSATGTSDGSGKLIITGLGVGVYTNIHVASPCVSNVVKTTIFASSSCIAPIVTPQDSTVKVCTPLATLGSPSATAASCPGYPKVAGATALATIESGQLCITYKPKPGFVGTDSVCVTLCDAVTATCTTIKVLVTIKPVPLAINDINVTLVNVPVGSSVATNDTKTTTTDVFTATTTPNHGTIVFNPNGTYTYTPSTDFVGKDSINYKICSVDNLCTTATLYLNVYKPSITTNLPPIAQNDVAQTNMNIPVSGNLASNDFDPENGALKYTLIPVSNPSHGTVSINANGSYTYTSNPGYIGTDTFEYQVCDDLNQCTTAKAVVYIRPDANGITTNDAPFAQDDSYRTTLSVPVTGNVRLNDSDPNGNVLTTTMTSPTTHGIFALAVNGAFTYTPTLGYFGTDQLKYKACDAAGLCDTATVYIVVVPPVPDAQLDVNITTKNNPISGNILTNDNGGGLAFTLTPYALVDPLHGAITLNANGSYTYTPTIDFVGKDSVQYVICNTASLCDTSWLTINVIDPIRFINNAPVASDDAGQTLKNIPVSGKVTNNDIDPDGDVLSASVIVQPDNGTVTLNTDGTYTYTPDPNFTGRDKFQYKVCDTKGACDTATVVITVSPDYNGTTNDRPNAQDDAALTNLNIPVSGILKSNDTDPNGNTLTYTTTPTTPPVHGTVTITAAGNYTYTPATGFFGTDQFKYKVCDNGSPTLCDTATVYVVVLAPTPDAQNDINVTLKNKPVSGNTATNDTGNGLPFTTNPILVKNPIYGNLTVATNGVYTYTPATGFVGKDSAQYVICNAASRCDSAWIIVTILPGTFVNGNNPPIANSDVVQTLKNVPVSGKVTNNDLEPDGDPLTATLTKSPVNGTIVFNPDGTFIYTPNANFVGNDVFCYKICDPSNACDSTCVGITVSPDINELANDKPNAQDDAAITAMNTAVTDQLKPNDSDPNVGQTLTYSNTPVTAPAHGTVTINPTTGQFVYTPTIGYSGTDKFLYKVCDNGTPSLCDTATVFLTIIPPVTNNPNAINDINLTFKNTPVSGNVLTNDDKAGQVVTTSLVTATPPKNGTITLLPNGNYTYVPKANFVGKDSTKYILCNTVSLCDTAWIYLNVLPYPPSMVDNNPPVASNDVSVTYLNKPVNGSVGNNDFDPDIAQILTYTNLTDPNDGILVFNPDGTYTYTPVTDFAGIDMFKYKVCDNGTPVKCDIATVTIEVKPKSANSNDKPVANDDAYVTYKGVGVNGNSAQNDSDPNGNTSGGEPLAFSKLTNPANGTVIMNANGTFSYAPNATFIGTDSFTYKICDNGTPVMCDTATVYLTVLPPKQPDANKPDAVNDIAMTIKNTPVGGNVLTNDDSKGNPLVVGLPSGTAPKHGIIAINPDGSFIYTPTTGYVGKDSVKYVICVNEIPMVRCDTAYIYFNVSDVPSPQNDKPIANNDVAKTEAGVPVKGNVLGNDVDPDLGDVLVATKLTDPAHGTVTLNPDGSYIYTPTVGFVGKDYFTYKACDNGNPVKCDSAKVEIDVTPVITPLNANSKPAAQDDALLTKINTPKSGTVALNDTAPDAGQTLVFSQLSNPAHGTITGFNPTTGTYTFTPTAGFVGNDSFKYKVCDNGSPVLCDSATVIITIETDDKITNPVAQNDIAITSPNTPVKGNVLTNDDSKGNPLMASQLTNPKNGTIVFNPNGSYTYTPNPTGGVPHYVGRDSVKYKVCNALIPVQCDSAWLYINTIPYPTAGNDKPVAMPDNVVTQQGSPVSSSVLGNDYDPDLGQTLTTSKISDPANGTVTVNANGTYTYTPNPTFVGTDVFKYKICDNGSPSLCDTTTVTIKIVPLDPTLPLTVNLKPDAGDDVVVSTGGQTVTTSVIGNDRDPNAGQTLTYTLLNQPTKGMVTLSPTGTLVWTPGIDPALPGATYTVKYKVCDNGSPVLCDTATVELRTQPSMTQPDAQDDIAVVRVNTPVTGNVLTNDDKKGLPVTPSVITPAKNGVFALNPDGSYTYTPNPNFVGVDSVKYKICNNAVPVECDSAWVTFKVIPDPATGANDKPVAFNDVTQTNAGTPVSGNASINDFDPDSGQTLTFTTLTNPTNGTATMNPNGTFTYTPNGGFTGTDVFKYKVCDNGTPVLCDTAKVIITVEPVTPNPAVNQPPVAIDDAILGIEGKPVTYNVSGNDKDPEGTPLAFTKLGGNPNVTIDALGNVTYTPAIDPLTGKPIGGNTVTYKVCDAGTPVKCDTATIYLTVSPSSTQPLAVNDINNTLINTTVTGDVLTNDDKKGLPVVVTQLTTAKHGSLTISPNGTYGYIPTTGFVGKDSVQYQICNNEVPAECSKAWLYINVAPLPNTANDKPIASADVAQTLVNIPVSGKVTNNDTDPEGGILTATKLTNPVNGTLVFNPDGTFTYTPNSGFIGKDKFTYKVCDTGSPVLCDTASVTIDVTPKLSPVGGNDAPNAQDDAIVTNINTAKTATVAPNDSDLNTGQTLSFMKVSNPVHGTVTVNADGSYTYIPTTAYTGPDKFTYKACDNGTPSLCDTATVYVSVLPSPIPTVSSPVAFDDINIVPKNTTVTGDVLTNDDKKGLPVTVSLLAPATHGTLTLNPNGTYSYTSTTGFIGKDSAQYQMCNNKVPAECDIAYVYLYVQDAPTVSPINNKPTAIHDVNQTLVNIPVSGTVASNDFDPDLGQTLAFTKLTNPTNGTAVLNTNGTYIYTPATGFVGTDVFKYKVCDNQTPALCDTTTVTIKVTPDYSGGGNIKPVANDDAYTTNKGVGINKSASLNDNDPNAGQTLSYSLLTLAANGTVSFNPDGTFAYTPNATFVGTDKFLYKVCDNGTPSLCDTATVYLSVKDPILSVCVNFNLKVLLEGPLNTVSGLMNNFLNVRGLLPGQTPIGITATPTPNGQPYSGTPWNYAGTEAMPLGGYATDIVDWVLISLRTDSLTTTPVFRAAGLLHADGNVTFVNPCFTIANGSYYVLVEHRNHMGVMSDKKITVTTGTLTYDFTTNDSYALTNPPSYGQKVKAGKYVMYAADHKKALQNDNFDINAADSNLWKLQSGIFDRYLSGDYNFDADVNNSDNTLWKVNNGRFSGVAH